MSGRTTWPIALWATGAMVVISPELLGGVRAWSVSTILVLATLSYAACHWEAYRRQREKLAWDPLIWAVGGCLAWTGFQALPLPCGVVAWLAPDAVGHVLANAELLHEAPTSCHLSRDPGATRLEVLKGLAILQAFLCGRWLARLGARRSVYQLVAASALLMMIVALAHWAAEADAVFGLYEPLHVRRLILLAPLMNQNNLGGFLAMAVPLCLGIAAEHRDATARFAWRVAAVLLSTTALLSLSRGAAAALVVGPGIFAVVLLRDANRSVSASARTSAMVALGTVALGVGVAVFVGFEGKQAALFDPDLGKLDQIVAALRLSLDHPLIGIGRGAFASAAVEFGPGGRAFYAENFVAQWAIEWGWPVALALLAAIVRALWRTLGESRPATIGAVCALVALGCQNLADLGLELIGPVVVAATLLGAATARHSQRLHRGRRTRMLRVLPALGAVAVLLAGAYPDDRTYHGQAAALHRALDGGSRKPFASTLRIALADHPQDPVFPLLAAAEAMAQDPGVAGRWLNRSMVLAPDWVEPHIQAAFWLAQLGHRSQAMLELRIAARIDGSRSRDALCRLLHDRPNAQEVMLAAPIGHERGAFIDGTIMKCLRSAVSTVAILDEDLLRTAPELLHPVRREVTRLIADGQLSAAVTVATELRNRWPDEPVVYRALAEAHSGAGDIPSALEAARAGVQRWPADAGLLQHQAMYAARAGDADLMRATMSTLMGRARGAKQLANYLSRLGRNEERLGNVLKAIAALRRAAEMDDNLPRLRQLARLCGKAGRVSSAQWAYRRICTLEPTDVEACGASKAAIR